MWKFKFTVTKENLDSTIEVLLKLQSSNTKDTTEVLNPTSVEIKRTLSDEKPYLKANGSILPSGHKKFDLYSLQSSGEKVAIAYCLTPKELCEKLGTSIATFYNKIVTNGTLNSHYKSRFGEYLILLSNKRRKI